jgi:hypothetical protein
LIVTLDSKNDGDVEQLRLDKAEERLSAYRNGGMSTHPGEEI